MPLRDTSSFDEWVTRERPAPNLQELVWDLIDDLGSSPLMHPSVLFFGTPDGTEVRSVAVPNTAGVWSSGVEVVYQIVHADRDVVDLILVTTLPLIGT